MKDDKKEAIYDEFKDNVNMSPPELEHWLETEDSKSVGQKDGGGESVGHESGREIIEIKKKNKADLTDADYEHMQKVNSYIARHSAQKPDKPEGSNWAYSLKNWGHDPMK